jgi:hypothetical protein
VPKRLQRSEAEQAHRDKIARQTKALPKEVRRAIGVARYGKSRPGVSEYRSFLGGKKLTTHELRGHLRDAGTRLILGIPAYGRRKLNKAERAKEAAMILEDTKMLRARLAMGSVRGKVRIRMPRSAGTVAKPKGLKPGVLAERRAARAAKALGLRARIDGDAFAARFRRARGASLRRAINESDRENALTSTQRRAVAPGKRYAASNMRQARADRTAAAAQDFYRNYGSPSAFSLRPSLSTANSPGFGSKRRSRRRR